MNPEKRMVQAFWDAAPCGTTSVPKAEDLRTFLEEIERERYVLEPFIFKHANFSKWKGKKVLEIGCGTGTDLLQFLKAGADARGIDLSGRSVAMARARLGLAGFHDGRVLLGDAEDLPFPENRFDLVYSWGVLHHTPDTAKTFHEVNRILRPGGEICIMLYHRWSLLSLQFYLRFALLKGQLFRSLDNIMAAHQESPGTKVYSRKQLSRLFARFEDVRIQSILTPYDLQYGRERFLPAWIHRLIPDTLGYFLVVHGKKPGSPAGSDFNNRR